ncbi:MAG: LysR family transcriptional regulator [Alphaproteobacteria bacterium]|nr:LysR family transcriptional regulator [Alphaproteobacteria bacterium]
MSPPDLNLLLALEALLAEGSVARAARRLRLSPSAMSRTLARLREATGDPLLVRAGRGLVPTPRAVELGGRLGGLVQEAQSVLRPAEALDIGTLDRTFTLRTSDGFVENFGPALVRSAGNQAPGVRLRFLQKPDRNSGPLRDGAVDLETGVIGEETSPEIRVLALFHDRFIYVVRAGHALAAGDVSAERYAAAEHVAVTRGGTSRGPVDVTLGLVGLKRRIAVSVGGFAAAVRAGVLGHFHAGRADRRDGRGGAVRLADPRHLFRGRPFPLCDDRRHGLPAVRRLLLLGADRQPEGAVRAPGSMVLRADVRGLQPGLLPAAHRRTDGHAAARMDLSRRVGLGLDQHDLDHRRLHPGAGRAGLPDRPGAELPPLHRGQRRQRVERRHPGMAAGRRLGHPLDPHRHQPGAAVGSAEPGQGRRRGPLLPAGDGHRPARGPRHQRHLRRAALCDAGAGARLADGAGGVVHRRLLPAAHRQAGGAGVDLRRGRLGDGGAVDVGHRSRNRPSPRRDRRRHRSAGQLFGAAIPFVVGHGGAAAGRRHRLRVAAVLVFLPVDGVARRLAGRHRTGFARVAMAGGVRPAAADLQWPDLVVGTPAGGGRPLADARRAGLGRAGVGGGAGGRGDWAAANRAVPGRQRLRRGGLYDGGAPGIVRVHPGGDGPLHLGALACRAAPPPPPGHLRQHPAAVALRRRPGAGRPGDGSPGTACPLEEPRWPIPLVASSPAFSGSGPVRSFGRRISRWFTA